MNWKGRLKAFHQPLVLTAASGRNELTNSETVGSSQMIAMMARVRCSPSRPHGLRRPAMVTGRGGASSAWPLPAHPAECTRTSGAAASHGHRMASCARKRRTLMSMTGMIASSRITATAAAVPTFPSVNRAR